MVALAVSEIRQRWGQSRPPQPLLALPPSTSPLCPRAWVSLGIPGYPRVSLGIPMPLFRELCDFALQPQLLYVDAEDISELGPGAGREREPCS